MPTYAYVAMNSSGQEVKEEIDANSSEEAISKIRSKGYFPTKVKEKAAKKAKKGKGGGGGDDAPVAAKKKMPMSIGGVPRKQLVAFTRQLSTLQDAGLPILRSLQILEQQQKPGLMKAIVGGVADEVEGGGTLSDAMSKWFANDYGWAYLIAAPFVITGLLKLIGLSEGGKYAIDVVKLKIPILGAILSKTSIARFTRTLGTLISAGVPILDAINITKETAGNEVYSRALVKVHDAIREGESMADPLRATKVCDAIVVNMIDVGEETGDLDKMLLKVADNYDNDVDVLVASLISILEPVMVVVLGVIVGFIVIALFMPMISLIQGMTSSGKKK